MSKTPCKSIKRDGSPCNGKGLEQFDGYCIAHAPADQTRAWRARGGTNSSTAARLDKRIPARLKNMMDMLEDGMNRVLKGTLSSADYTVICRGAKVRIDLYRLADEEMEAIRAEETQTAAEEIAGAHGDLAILKAADAITAQQNQYRIDSLIDQDLATCDSPQTDDRPADYILTDEGRRRFDFRHQASFTQQDIDDLKAEVMQNTYERGNLPLVSSLMNQMREDMEAALADLTRDPALDPAPPLDPLTGQAFNELPAGLKTGQPQDPDPADVVLSPQILKDMIRQVEELTRLFEQQYPDEQYDHEENLHRANNDPDPATHNTITAPYSVN